MSLPNEPEPPLRAELAPARTEPPRQLSRGIRLMTWLLLLAIIGPCAVTQAPLEIGRWRLAAAVHLRSKGEKAAAYEELEKAIGWFPRSPELFLQRAEWKLDDGQRAEAFADVDRILEFSATSSASERHKWLTVHSMFLQNNGEFSKAVDDLKKIDELSHRSGIPDRATALNGLAYAQALAKVELDEALDSVKQALELQPNSAAIIDTRGFIYHQQGQYSPALDDFNDAVKGMSREKEAIQRAFAKGIDVTAQRNEKTSWRPRTLAEFEPASDLERLTRAARAIAVMHYHRALTLSALDRKDEAEKDLAIARKLIGREPDESLF